MDISRWQYPNQIDYILCGWRWRSSIQSGKTRLGADCGLDRDLLIAKLRLKLKKVGKTTRPLRYDLNQIPYDYTVEVKNRPKGLDLIECLKNLKGGPWHSIGGSDQDCPQGKDMQKEKRLSEGALQYLSKEEKQKTKEKRKDIPIWMQSSKE